jgi:beta-carotene 15,15'-dioxygenase
MRAGARWSRVVVGAAAVSGAGLTVLPATASAPFVLAISAGGLLAGLPHGAIDHALTSRFLRLPLWQATAGYAAVAALAYVALRAGGGLALAVVVVVSVAHFGLGESQTQRALTGWSPGRVVSLSMAIAGTGALLLPLARSGDQLRGIATTVSPWLADLLVTTPLRVAVASVWALAALITVTAAQRAHQRQVAVDVALVALLGVTAPPMMAFAIWFGGWHAIRHMARLLTVEPRCAALLAAGQPRRAAAALARQATWPSLAAATFIAVLILGTAAAPDLDTALAQALRVLLALTVPHMLVVFCLDRRPAR